LIALAQPLLQTVHTGGGPYVQTLALLVLVVSLQHLVFQAVVGCENQRILRYGFKQRDNIKKRAGHAKGLCRWVEVGGGVDILKVSMY